MIQSRIGENKYILWSGFIARKISPWRSRILALSSLLAQLAIIPEAYLNISLLPTLNMKKYSLSQTFKTQDGVSTGKGFSAGVGVSK
jgi:hypothetical protein